MCLFLLHVLFRDGVVTIACSLAEAKVSWLACKQAVLNNITFDCNDR